MKETFCKHFNLALITLFVTSRILAIAFLYWITDGKEVASDVAYLHMMIENPFGSLLGTASYGIASYPPLQPIVLAGLYWPFSQLTPDFVAVRLVTATIELAAFLVAIKISNLKVIPRPIMIATLLLIIAAPYAIFSSIFFVQDEVLCQLFIALAAYNVLRHKIGLALLSLACGILFGKVFLIVPLFYLLVFSTFKPQHLLNVILVGGVYALVIYMATQTGGHIPFVGFSPAADYSSHYWVLLAGPETISSSTLKFSSLLMSLIFQLLLLGFIFINRQQFVTVESKLFLLSLPLTLFFFTFYQHNPEYVSIFAVVAFLLGRSITSQAVTALTLCLAWLPNIINGVQNSIEGGDRLASGRDVFFGSWVEHFPISFSTVHTVSVLVYSACYLLLLVTMFSNFKKLSNRSPEFA